MSINIEQIIADIHKHCLERSFIVYPGCIFTLQIQRCTWEEPEQSDWHPFIEIARQCGVKMVHLSVNKFDYEPDEIDNLSETITDSDGINAELLKEAKASIGKPFAFELSFVYNQIVYELVLENDLGKVASLINKDEDDDDEDDDEIDGKEMDAEREAEMEEKLQELRATAQEIVTMPEYRQFRNKSQFPDRDRFVMRILQHERGQPYNFAFKVARLAEQEFTLHMHPEFTKENASKLSELRKSDPKLTKTKALALLKIPKSELESIWYDFSES